MSVPAMARRATGTWLIAAVVVTLSACATGSRDGGYYKDDGPPARPAIDPMSVPDAVPRAEPVLASAANRPYEVFGRTYRPLPSSVGYKARGTASWYGKRFHGRQTSSGEPYDMYAMTAAHRTLPIPSYVRVRNLDNDRTVVVRVNDRGPFRDNRLIDISYAAATRLGIIGAGTGRVEVEAVMPGAQQAATSSRVPSGAAPVVAALSQPAPAGNAVARESATVYDVWIQVGAFKLRENAQRLAARLRRDGVSPVEIQQADSRGTRFYRVRVGPLPQSRMEQMLARLDPGIVSEPRVIYE